MATQEDVILVQEHHLLAPALSVEIEAMGAIGYDSFLMPASPGQGSRNSSQGGVGILVKTHLGARLRAQFAREGCGYVAVTIRTQGLTSPWLAYICSVPQDVRVLLMLPFFHPSETFDTASVVPSWSGEIGTSVFRNY